MGLFKSALDSSKTIQALDKSKLYDSILQFPDQISQAWEEVGKIMLPGPFLLCKKVVFCGMGGSALGGRIVDSLLEDKVRITVEVCTYPTVPSYTDPETLVILTSYSGNTEETLLAAEMALKKGAQIFIITTGGKLADFMRTNNLAGYIFVPKYNPCGQPRMGLGYSISASLAVLAKSGLIEITDQEIIAAASSLRKVVDNQKIEIPRKQNVAKEIAEKFAEKIPVIVGSEHLVGPAHAFKNMLNENAKVFTSMFDIPELNHHLMEGLKYPVLNRKLLQFIFIESALYSDFIKSRFPITQEVVAKNGIKTSTYSLTLDTKMSQILEIIIFGSFVSFYLAILYKQDPTPIPWVDYFKGKLNPVK